MDGKVWVCAISRPGYAADALPQAQVLKKIIEAIKDLVADAPIECTSEGISMQVISWHVWCLCFAARPECRT